MPWRCKCGNSGDRSFGGKPKIEVVEFCSKCKGIKNKYESYEDLNKKKK